ncbi:MAG: type II secretion system protein [Candidatus Omnitrophica bacterium]|nr:type II secretion system protein [Candidatus Omnitrophota bacterium]
MIPNTKCRRGFTLIELLVVVAVFMILAVLVTNSLFSILKSNTKANIMKEIRQNGAYALDVMDKTISSSRKIEECKSSSLTVTDVGGNQQITFGCLSQSVGGLPQISLASKVCSDNGCSDNVRLTSTNITLENCNVFTCEEIESGEGFGKVTINFTLKQLGASTRPEEIARQTFTKTIFLRNK